MLHLTGYRIIIQENPPYIWSKRTEAPVWLGLEQNFFGLVRFGPITEPRC
jgi:hypothetical protein